MAASVGQGSYSYEVAEGWKEPPAGYEWGQIGAVAVDSKDQVYLFTRTDHPLMVFDKEGAFLRSWGEGVFKDAPTAYVSTPMTTCISSIARPR
jgi:hypothetical protein